MHGNKQASNFPTNEFDNIKLKDLDLSNHRMSAGVKTKIFFMNL